LGPLCHGKGARPKSERERLEFDVERFQTLSDSGRMQGAAKRRILEVFKQAATQQSAQNLPERRRGGSGLSTPPMPFLPKIVSGVRRAKVTLSSVPSLGGIGKRNTCSLA